jgi:hypothetical protein
LCQERYDQHGTEPPGYQGKSPLVEDAAEHRAWPFSPACGDLWTSPPDLTEASRGASECYLVPDEKNDKIVF